MSNVVSLLSFKEKKDQEKKEEKLGMLVDSMKNLSGQEKKKVAGDIFKEAERRNAEKAEKLRKERLDANKSVLRSYNIKK